MNAPELRPSDHAPPRASDHQDAEFGFHARRFTRGTPAERLESARWLDAGVMTLHVDRLAAEGSRP